MLDYNLLINNHIVTRTRVCTSFSFAVIPFPFPRVTPWGFIVIGTTASITSTGPIGFFIVCEWKFTGITVWCNTHFFYIQKQLGQCIRQCIIIKLLYNFDYEYHYFIIAHLCKPCRTLGMPQEMQHQGNSHKYEKDHNNSCDLVYLCNNLFTKDRIYIILIFRNNKCKLNDLVSK